MDTPFMLPSTSRLNFRRIELADSEFILELYNTPAFKEYIGDRNLRSTDDATTFIRESLIPMYQKQGHGLYLVEEKSSGKPLGICGLLKRPHLEHADLGYGFLPEYEGNGYAFEATSSTLSFAKSTLGLQNVWAICTSHNHRSINLLNRLNFRFDKVLEPVTDHTDLQLYTLEL